MRNFKVDKRPSRKTEVSIPEVSLRSRLRRLKQSRSRSPRPSTMLGARDDIGLSNFKQIRNFNPKIFTGKAISFLQKTLKENHYSKVVVALSGGVDSAVSLVLAVKALGCENILAALLPCGKVNKEGLERARTMLKTLKTPKQNIFEIDIEKMARKIADERKIADKLRRGNIISRLRMIIVYDLAKENKALVLGTENKSEHLLGYFTRFGDAASDIELIRSLYKTEVYQLAKYLKVPDAIVSAPPTAGLWEGQTDENELGFSYNEADKVLYYLYEKRISGQDLIKRGFKKELIEKVKKQVKKNWFKHKTPYVFKQTTKS